MAETLSDIFVNDKIEVKSPAGKGDAQSSDSEEFSRLPTGLEGLDIETIVEGADNKGPATSIFSNDMFI